MTQIIIPKIEEITIRDGGNAVLLLSNGRRIASLPYEAALALSKAIRIQAKRVEERAKALQIRDDQAVLMRARMPIGLSDNQDILNEARKEAHYNSNLRRYLPHVEPTMEVFTPRIIKHPPRKEGDNERKL